MECVLKTICCITLGDDDDNHDNHDIYDEYIYNNKYPDLPDKKYDSFKK